MKKIKIIYIAGNGHSGSTLLDIAIGNSKGFFSLGEINFFTRRGILEEYCSCHKSVGSCEFWKKVYRNWNTKAEITLSEYRKLQFKIEPNSKIFNLLFHCTFNTSLWQSYIKHTELIYKSITNELEDEVLVDSSKAPMRLVALRQFSDIQVIHLCRNYLGVLNSSQNSSKKNLEKGIEADNPAKNKFKTTIDWLINNVFAELSSIGLSKIKLRYKDFVNSPDKLSLINTEIHVTHDTKLVPEHLIAGNIIRLKPDLKLSKRVGFSYKRLQKAELFIGKLIEKIFWFWC